MHRRKFLKTAAGLFVPAAPALIIPCKTLAQGGMAPGPGTVHSAGGGGFTSLNWTAGDQIDPPNSPTHTFVNEAIGAANANRIVAVGVWWRLDDTSTITALTIQSIAATQVTGAKVVRSDGGAALSTIFYAAVPTGTTADIAITQSIAFQRIGIVVYRIVTTTPAPTSSSFGIDTDGDATTGSVTVSGGAGLAVFGARNQGNATTWTNATSDYDFNNGTFSVSGAHFTATAAITGAGSGSSGCCISAAAWS